jgi:peptide/nickel transport system substrate-binding protein
MPIEDMAESWTAVSDTVFDFHIKRGVQFHGGYGEVTAHDYVASFDYVRNYPLAAASRISIARYEAIDDYTLRIDTDIPNAMLIIDLTHHSNTVMPASLINAGHDFNEIPIGTGPFSFNNWSFGTSLTYDAFEQYFDRERAARVESVTWRIIPEGTSRTIALETGEAHYNQYVQVEDVVRLQDHPNIELHLVTGTSHNKLLMNNELPMFQDGRVRRALGMAIDLEAVAVVGMNGYAIPTWSQVPMIFEGATNEGTYSFDPEGAKALLAEAGVDPSTISFSIIVSNEERRRMGEVFQANLADIGVHVEVEFNDLATTLERTQQGNYETGFGGFNSSSFLGYVRGVLHSSQVGASNRSRIVNHELTELIDQALATMDPAAQIPIFEQISRVANEHTGHIPTHLAMVIKAHTTDLNVPELPATGALWLNMMSWK